MKPTALVPEEKIFLLWHAYLLYNSRLTPPHSHYGPLLDSVDELVCDRRVDLLWRHGAVIAPAHHALGDLARARGWA